ncbi:hypothetical protein, partial [Xanthomonas perforans]|uniref:hypothetical protein n=1 Tax=Xanthomonas perforans TaxID=442694 RepID=UPI001939FAA8
KKKKKKSAQDAIDTRLITDVDAPGSMRCTARWRTRHWRVLLRQVSRPLRKRMPPTMPME